MNITIKDYNLQNIIFVHNFVMTILILVLFFVSVYLFLTIFKYNWNSLYIFFKLEKLSFLNKDPIYVKDLDYFNELPLNKLQKVTQLYKLQYDLKFNHNILLEIIWTIIPIIFILEMIFPSLSLIADDEIDSKGSLYTIGVIGNQWYWNYELNIIGIVIKYVSNLMLLDESKRTHLYLSRLLTTTKTLPISVGIKTSFYITSNDVAHSWALPSLGIKVDAIPGRINLKTVIPTRLGLYNGMCSEICGVEHGFMPISVQVLTFDKFWLNIKEILENKNKNLSSNNIWVTKFI